MNRSRRRSTGTNTQSHRQSFTHSADVGTKVSNNDHPLNGSDVKSEHKPHLKAIAPVELDGAALPITSRSLRRMSGTSANPNSSTVTNNQQELAAPRKLRGTRGTSGVETASRLQRQYISSSGGISMEPRPTVEDIRKSAEGELRSRIAAQLEAQDREVEHRVLRERQTRQYPGESPASSSRDTSDRRQTSSHVSSGTAMRSAIPGPIGSRVSPPSHAKMERQRASANLVNSTHLSSLNHRLHNMSSDISMMSNALTLETNSTMSTTPDSYGAATDDSPMGRVLGRQVRRILSVTFSDEGGSESSYAEVSDLGRRGW
jgi:malate synthase